MASKHTPITAILLFHNQLLRHFYQPMFVDQERAVRIVLESQNDYSPQEATHCSAALMFIRGLRANRTETYGKTKN